MKVLVACEYSGIVRDTFIAEGHDAISCDLLPSERPGPHIQGDVRPLLQERWDLVIAHPPCNYLTMYTWAFNNQHRYPDWWERFWDGVNFWWDCVEANAPMVAIENPPRMNPPARRLIGLPNQRTDFRDFGDPVRKGIGWWLKGLPPLMATMRRPDAQSMVVDRVGKTDGLWGLRSKQRSQFQPGMAAAMARQWGGYARHD